MALNRIACPECGAGLRSSTGFRPGQTASCPKCETDFTVEEPANAALSIDDEDDQPGKKKRRDDDWAYKNSWMRYAVLGVLLAVLGVLGYMLYDKKMNEGKETAGVTEDEEFKPVTPKGTLPPGMGPLPQLNPAGGGAGPPPKAQSDPDGKTITAAEAKALLVGNWESKTKDADRSLEYGEDGGFSFAVENQVNGQKKIIQGRWKIETYSRVQSRTGGVETIYRVELTPDGKPAVTANAAIKRDGTMEHPMLDLEGNGLNEQPGAFAKKK